MWCGVCGSIVLRLVQHHPASTHDTNLAPAIEPSRGIEAGRSCNPVAHPRQELFSCVACAVSEILVCEWKVINVLRLIRQVNGSVVISGG